MASLRSFSINLLGDVMLGRLVDQLFPVHVDEPSDAKHVPGIRRAHPELRNYGPKDPWNTTLPLLESADLNLINLETAMTTHPKPWPHKAFNFRMHPANIDVLRAGRIDYASVANNHILDFCEEGMRETLATLRGAGIQYAGAGGDLAEATRPAVLPLWKRETHEEPRDGRAHFLSIFSASDHPESWSSISGFHLIGYDAETRERLKRLISRPTQGQQQRRGEPREGDHPPLKIFSVHWGPNYAWSPDPEIRSLAHYLVDDCGVDIVHGHSAHHIQGVEIYNKKLIIYGCGDFVDDYAVSSTYRNDLGALWRVTVSEEEVGGSEPALAVKKLEVFPTKIALFRANLLGKDEQDHHWLRRTFVRLCDELGTAVRTELGAEGQLIIDV